MKQGEIWLINLDPTVGAEIKKTRPAVIVNDNSVGKLPLKIIVPLTEWKDRYEVAPWMIRIISDSNTKIKKESAADCFQIRSISERRFIRSIGKISQKQMEQIKEGISKVLSIGI